MKKINLEVIQRDRVEIELDESYFDKKWFEWFHKYFYNIKDLKGLAEHIAYNVVHNSATEIEGVGIPLRDGERPYWIKKDQEVNKHVNVIYNIYATDVEVE